MKNRILEFLPPEWRLQRLRERVEALPETRQWVDKAERYVAEHPGACIAAAFAAGVAVAWWIKRK
jgi:ElaB/YqjD/DUF883 family membrane-anchored ribosome-binding protein